MSISSMMPLIEQQIKSTSKMDVAGNSDLTSLMYTTAVATAVPAALFPPGPTPIPLIPVGFSLCQNMLKTAFTLDIAGKPDLVAQTMATAFSLLAPMAPPTGLSLLKTQLKQTFNMDIAGTPELTSKMIALAIINYYNMAPTV